MSSTIKKKLSLNQKLAETNLKKQIKNKEANKIHVAQIPDIEDTLCIKSPYFSPIQTRQQRKILDKPIKIRELTNVPLESAKIKKEINNLEQCVETTIKNVQILGVLNKIEIKSEWQPNNCQEMLENIRKMRLQTTAPVDTMGCHKCSKEDVTPMAKRFRVLLALMLSSQTKDETTFKVMQRLQTNITDLSPQSISLLAINDLENLLNPVSFYKTKAKHIQLTSRILIEQYNSDIPRSVQELIKLPGVGPKMAHLCMSSAWNEVTGIGVDVHVHRISNRLKWVPKETKEPEQTRVALEKWLPRELWQEVNHLLVGFGQTVCTPLRPHCGDCLNQNICPSAFKDTTVKSKQKIVKKDKKILL